MTADRRTAKARGTFSPTVKARLFAWDRAVCAFSGASLWVLDYGACSLFHEDWMDHIRPAARGGTHDVTNGICASEIANWVKGANGRANLYWFVGGRPTCHFYDAVGRVPSDIARRLRRDVRSRDWYLNHCFRNLLWRVNNRVNRSRDRRHTNTPGYYASAALGVLEDYRRVWANENENTHLNRLSATCERVAWFREIR
jgi:hypothetical protein